MINIRSKTALPNHIARSPFNTIFTNLCCLGFTASTYSMKSTDQKMVCDVTGTQAYDSTAKCLNTCTLVLGLLLIIMFEFLF